MFLWSGLLLLEMSLLSIEAYSNLFLTVWMSSCWMCWRLLSLVVVRKKFTPQANLSSLTPESYFIYTGSFEL